MELLPPDVEAVVLATFSADQLGLWERASKANVILVQRFQIWRRLLQRDYPEAHQRMRDPDHPTGMVAYLREYLDRHSIQPERPQTYWKRYYEFIQRSIDQAMDREEWDEQIAVPRLVHVQDIHYRLNVMYDYVIRTREFYYGIRIPENNVIPVIEALHDDAWRAHIIEEIDSEHDMLRLHSKGYLTWILVFTDETLMFRHIGAPGYDIMRDFHMDFDDYGDTRLMSCRVCGTEAKYVEDAWHLRPLCGPECQRTPFVKE